MPAGPSTHPAGARTQAVAWVEAVAAAYQAGVSSAGPVVALELRRADGATLAVPLAPQTDLPPFPSASVDGWAVRGPGPWRPVGRVLAGVEPAPLTEDGTCVEIATGAMVPTGTEHIIRVEESSVDSLGRVSGEPRRMREWRQPGEEADRDEELLPAGTPVTPGVIGLAASCGYDTLQVRRPPRTALLIFGDELLAAGLPGAGRIRDSLGPSLPAWLRRCGAGPVEAVGPVEDTLTAHLDAIRSAVDSGADLICTTGGTMNGPVDHLHPALTELGAGYVVNTVAVRPGFPMLLATVPRASGPPVLLAGLPGNPQSAVIALMSLVVPALAGLTGRDRPELPRIRLGAPVPGRGDHTHLALVRVDRADGLAYPVPHVGSAMLRGLAGASGFAVIMPGQAGEPGDVVALLPLPLSPGEHV